MFWVAYAVYCIIMWILAGYAGEESRMIREKYDELRSERYKYPKQYEYWENKYGR